MMKKPIVSFVGHVGALLALCAFSGQEAYARHLQPEEALSMVRTGAMRSVSSARLKLAYTQKSDASVSTVYVFDREGAPGFYVLAADDAVGDIVLGYSHTGSFSAENMAPGMKWLLGVYSAQVSRSAEAAVPAGPKKVPQGLQAVTPLLSTVWNQYEPYNDMCPEINGMRAVTGCVATAMAQVMKKHQWPVSGTGSYSYVANGISVSSDFSSHVYDWDNMLDDYYNEYYDLVGTQAQRNAVAQLMFDCGVAARMTYSASESSAMTIAAGGGMTKYFNYDKSMEYVLRGWYSDEDWMRLMHSQISEGLPVIYAGDSEGGYGHAFILDGYDGEGYFHFNWGWGGGSDGYFSLSYNAAPGEDIGYVFNQEALVNIRPDKGSSYSPVMGIEGVFCTTSTEYSCAGDYMELTVENGTGGFYSYALTTMEYEIGVKNTLDGNVVSMGSYSLDPYYGFRGFGLDSRFFPVGEYDVYLVYKTADTDWTPMKCFVGLTSGRLHFVNDGTTITVSEKEEDITVANQAAYEAVIAEIEALKAEYEGTVAQLKEENPDYDFSEWEEIIGGALEMAGTGAAQALAAANEDGEAFAFAFDGEEIRLMIDAMIEDVKTSGIEIIENMVSEGKAMIYTLDGRKVASLARGEVNIIVTPTSTKKVYIRK